MTTNDLTRDEQYVFSERLGMCGCVDGQEPTNEQLNIAWDAVEAFRNNPMPTK